MSDGDLSRSVNPSPFSSEGVADSQDNAKTRDEAAGGSDSPRDMTPALGSPGQPGRYRRAQEGGTVAHAQRAWGDSIASFIYGKDTIYEADAEGREDAIAAVARAQRTGDMPDVVQAPMMKPAVWTWEVPLYFWFGGIASGSAFVAMACDVSGDHKSAAVARKVALAALLPSPPLLVMDLGRPERFLNMLRVFKPRSPMSMGAWCLSVFGALASAAVGADLLGREKAARRLGGANAVVAGYLGSYTGVLLASTAVPVWSRSRFFLGPIFVCTAAATGAAASRFALVATGVPAGHPTREALGRVETWAIAAELAMSTINERRLGRVGEALEQGTPGRLFRFAKWSVRSGLALRLLRNRVGPVAHHVASGCYLAGGLAFRYAWVGAGRTSANDHDVVARTARGRATRVEPDARSSTVTG